MTALQGLLGASLDRCSRSVWVQKLHSVEQSPFCRTRYSQQPVRQNPGDAMRGRIMALPPLIRYQLRGTVVGKLGSLGRVLGDGLANGNQLSASGLWDSYSLGSQRFISDHSPAPAAAGHSLAGFRVSAREGDAARVSLRRDKAASRERKFTSLESRQERGSQRTVQSGQGSRDRFGFEPQGSREVNPPSPFSGSDRKTSGVKGRGVTPRRGTASSDANASSADRSSSGQTQATQAQSRVILRAQSVAAAERSRPYVEAEIPYPTAVPRPPHLRDGDWTQADAAAVRGAMNDSAHLAPKFSAAPSQERGNNVLIGRSLEELEQLAVELGEQKYRGKQLHQFLYKNKGKDLNELLQLPQKMRMGMEERGFTVGRIPVHHVAAAADGTAKILLRLDDDRLVEAVGIPMEMERGVQKLTACVSSQVGCPLRCTFCATGKGGFARNLRPHEIVGQVLALEELFAHRVNNIVFMGMGEPLLNLPSLMAAHRCLNKDLGIGQRMMTISTVGVPNTIRRLATHKLQSTLAVSLHASNQQLREQLVPSAKAYPLEALLEDCRAYFETTGRRVSFEYTLLAAVNDQPSHANELADLLHRWKLGNHVNVIPYNPVADSDYRRPNKAHVVAFTEVLKNRKVTATVRQTRGLEANAACGQLRNEFQKTPLTTAVAT